MKTDNAEIESDFRTVELRIFSRDGTFDRRARLPQLGGTGEERLHFAPWLTVASIFVDRPVTRASAIFVFVHRSYSVRALSRNIPTVLHSRTDEGFVQHD